MFHEIQSCENLLLKNSRVNLSTVVGSFKNVYGDINFIK